MKNLIFIFLIFALFGFNKDEQFKIKGHVQNRNKGSVRLFQFNESAFDSKVSEVVNGEFIFEGSIKYPEHFAIEFIESGAQFKSTFESFKFFIEPSAKVSIELFPGSISNSIITGSNLSKEFMDIEKKIEIPLKKLAIEYGKASKNNDTELKKIIFHKGDSVNNGIIKWKFKYIKDNPKSLYSTVIFI